MSPSALRAVKYLQRASHRLCSRSKNLQHAKNARAIEVSTVRVADRREESISRELRAVSPRVFRSGCIDHGSALLLPILPGTQILRFNRRGRVRTHDFPHSPAQDKAAETKNLIPSRGGQVDDVFCSISEDLKKKTPSTDAHSVCLLCSCHAVMLALATLLCSLLPRCCACSWLLKGKKMGRRGGERRAFIGSSSLESVLADQIRRVEGCLCGLALLPHCMLVKYSVLGHSPWMMQSL